MICCCSYSTRTLSYLRHIHVMADYRQTHAHVHRYLLITFDTIWCDRLVSFKSIVSEHCLRTSIMIKYLLSCRYQHKYSKDHVLITHTLHQGLPQIVIILLKFSWILILHWIIWCVVNTFSLFYYLFYINIVLNLVFAL
jgi:hypothetical protein